MKIPITSTIKRKISDLAAWLDPTEGGELVNVKNSNLLVKLLAAMQAQRGWRRGFLDAQKNVPRLIEMGDALASSIFTASSAAPLPNKNNTIAIIAAYINSDLKLRGIVHNIKKIKPHCGKIIVVDIAENLTEPTVAKIMAAYDNIKVMSKNSSDLLYTEAWRVGLTDEWALTAEHFLLLTDSIVIIKDMQPLFAMAAADQGQHDRYGVLEVCETLPYISTTITLLNTPAKDFFVRYVEQTAPIAVALLNKKREAPKAYYEIYRKSIIVFVYESELSRHIKSRALFSFRQDKRLEGINLHFHDAALFREYLGRGYPLFAWKQLKRRAFRPLLEGYVPGNE